MVSREEHMTGRKVTNNTYSEIKRYARIHRTTNAELQFFCIPWTLYPCMSFSLVSPWTKQHTNLKPLKIKYSKYTTDTTVQYGRSNFGSIFGINKYEVRHTQCIHSIPAHSFEYCFYMANWNIVCCRSCSTKEESCQDSRQQTTQSTDSTCYVQYRLWPSLHHDVLVLALKEGIRLGM